MTAIAPETGSVLRGQKVTITGTNLNGATGVAFGEVPATSFNVVSEEEITATAPAQAKPGTVDVVVTTIAGASPVTCGDNYYNTGCVVSKVVGRTLKQAKSRLRDAGCKIGHVGKKRTGKNGVGKVVTQTPKPGKVLASGATVAVKVGR